MAILTLKCINAFDPRRSINLIVDSVELSQVNVPIDGIIDAKCNNLGFKCSTYEIIDCREEKLPKVKEEQMQIRLTDITREFNAMAKSHNQLVDNYTAIRQFLILISGILYTAITGDTKQSLPLKEVSIFASVSNDVKDLNYLRNGIIIFVRQLDKEDKATGALTAFLTYVATGGIK